MRFEKESLESALEILRELLVEKTVTKSTNPKNYRKYEQDSEVRELLEIVTENLDLFVCEYRSGLYLSPGLNNGIFCFSNAEIKRELRSGFNNPEMYTAFFIIHIIVSEFYKESYYDTRRVKLSINNLLDSVEKKIVAMSEFEDLDKVSDDYKFNFAVVRDCWNKLPKTERQENSDDIKQRGKNSKLAFVNQVIEFLKKQGLVTENNNAIYVTNRFKAIIAVAYNNPDIQIDITEFIEDLNSGEEI